MTSADAGASRTRRPGPAPRLPGRTRWQRRLVGAGLVLALLALIGTLVQPVRVRLVAAATVADALDLPVPRPLAADVDRERTTVAGVEGDLYDVAPDAPAIALVPGAAPEGIEDPRIVELAEALAGAGRTVFIPQLEVYEQDLVLDDVERIVRVVLALADDERGPAAIVGTSFGGSLGLLAAADERLEDRLATVATFGAYADLVGVIQATTTGVAVVGDRRIPWDADPRADEVVREQVAELLPADQRRELRRALEGERDPDDLEEDTRAAHALLVNEDPERTYPLARRLPDEMRTRLAEVSPVTRAGEIRAPVVALHSTEDPAIPYGELLRLEEAIPHARPITLRHFDHVGIDLDSPGDAWRAAGDLWRAWRFATAVLQAQEPWLP